MKYYDCDVLVVGGGGAALRLPPLPGDQIGV